MQQGTHDFSYQKNELPKALTTNIKLYNSISGLEEINPNATIEEIREKVYHAFSCVDAIARTLQHIEGELNKLIE